MVHRPDSGPKPSPAAERILDGDVRTAARLMRDLEDGVPSATRTLRELLPRTGRAYVIGLTGAPGTGKSSLTDRLVALHRATGRNVGVVAVDPTSAFSGGALLGDRIRMQDHAVDPGVFIRSMATRGQLGGLSRAAADVVDVLDAMGKDVVLVETVGVGQDEVEVASLAHTVVVVTAPGLGDYVQALKESVLEIADVLAVNKTDREGADRTVSDLAQMLEIRRCGAARETLEHDSAHRFSGTTLVWNTEHASFWEPPIVKTVAVRNEGVHDLAQAVERHRLHLETSGLKREREVSRARARLLALLRERLIVGALERLTTQEGDLDELAARIVAHEADPFQLMDDLVARVRA